MKRKYLLILALVASLGVAVSGCYVEREGYYHPRYHHYYHHEYYEHHY